MTVEHPARQEHISGNDEVGVKKIQFLLDAGGDVNAPNDNRWIPLLEACYWSRPATARLLLENGADVNIADGSGNTALHFACIYGSVSCARLLLSHGADVNARNNAGYTPLMRIFTGGSSRIADIVRLLLERGADVNNTNAKDNLGSTLLHCACGGASARLSTRGGVIYRTCPNDYYPTIRLLLEHGADPDIRDKEGKSSLDLVLSLPPDEPAREEILDLFRERAPESTLESVLKLPFEDPLRERTLDWYREHHPEMVMEAYCSRQGPGGGR